MLPSTCSRETLLACPPSPLNFPSLWSPPFPFFLYDAPLLHTLTLSLLMIWCSGQMPLFLFLLAREAPAYLPTAHSMALRPLFHFQQAQYAEVFLLKPVPFCTLFAGLGSTNKSAISLLLYDSRSVLSSIFPSTSISLAGTVLSPAVLPGYNGSPDTHFSWVTMRLMSWPVGEHYSCPLQYLVVFLVSTLFSRTGGILSHQNSLTHRFPQFPPRNLCFLVILAVFSLVYAAANTGFCLVLISLGLAESRILSEASAGTHPSTPLISFCTVQLRTLCAACSLETLCLSTTSGPGHGELPSFWGLMVFPNPRNLNRATTTKGRATTTKGRVTTTTTN